MHWGLRLARMTCVVLQLPAPAHGVAHMQAVQRKTFSPVITLPWVPTCPPAACLVDLMHVTGQRVGLRLA